MRLEASKPKPGPPRGASPLSTLPSNGETPDDLLDLIAGMQSKRMDEQRAELPRVAALPGLCPPAAKALAQRRSLAQGTAAVDTAMPDEAFLEMLMRSQVNHPKKNNWPVSNKNTIPSGFPTGRPTKLLAGGAIGARRVNATESAHRTR